MVAGQIVVAALPILMRAIRKDAPPQRHPLPSLRRAFSIYDQINLIDNVPEDQLRFQDLSIFQSVQPLPDVEGTFSQLILNFVALSSRSSTGMKVEVIDSRNAASTYNVLNEEGRIVAAALLP